ncbi:hypothetical protein M427DRAFT_136675 [Gonapodya prolifera JEL478]|uniref:Uncharacterized protein n=1 Tax=Gonapodya prolifera (strain JEL478) TaxID=1344416 RepID=A0A139A8W2_GONPJ|nr:hypothetical protein M427DRAFT_136675 [Gonapodya prolifera JEL478]|eukprot:KXS13230.1 hypothetical protein M427DRAFT_136675 [Gonapodya prolifera JEL478]
MPGPPLEELSQYERLGDNSYYVKLGRVLQFPERHSWVVGIVKTHLTSNPVVLGNTSTKFAVTIEDSGVIFHCTTQHFILRKHATLLGIRDQADSTYTSLGEGLEEDDTEDSADDCAPPIETFISNGIDRAFRHQGAIAPMMGPSSIKADLQTECNGLEAECATYLKCVLQAVMLTYGGTGLGKDLRDFTNEYLKQKKMTPADVTHLDNLGVFKAFSLAVNPKASTPTSTVKKPKIGSLMAMISSLAPLSPSFYDCIATLITYRCEVAHRLKRDEGLDSGVAGCMAGATEELTTYIHKNQLIARLLPASKSARTHSEVRIVTDGDGAFGRVQALVK